MINSKMSIYICLFHSKSLTELQIRYPPHAHDPEEWYLVLSGNPQWLVDGEKFQAKPGDFIHHPPRATHSMVTSDKPLLALWMRTGELDGAYWFVDESLPEQKPTGRRPSATGG